MRTGSSDHDSLSSPRLSSSSSSSLAGLRRRPPSRRLPVRRRRRPSRSRRRLGPQSPRLLPACGRLLRQILPGANRTRGGLLIQFSELWRSGRAVPRSQRAKPGERSQAESARAAGQGQVPGAGAKRHREALLIETGRGRRPCNSDVSSTGSRVVPWSVLQRRSRKSNTTCRASGSRPLTWQEITVAETLRWAVISFLKHPAFLSSS